MKVVEENEKTVEEKTVEEKPVEEAIDSKEEIEANEQQNDTKDKEETKKKKEKKKDKIEILEEENANLRDQLLRNRAELENFKKRMNEERIKDRKYASFSLVSELIASLDNLNRVVNMETDNEVLKNFLIGFKMINSQLFEILKNDGVSEIKAKGLAFDPAVHQAVSTEKQEGVEKGIVLEELQKGYKYKDRVIRPSMVKVSE